MKTKPETVTYDIVFKKIQELHDAGEKISIRRVITHTGGSSGKIAEYIKRWYKDTALLQDYAISDTLIAALASERQSIIKSISKTKDQEISVLNSLVKELQEINFDQEKKLIDYLIVKDELSSCRKEITMLERELRNSRDSADAAITKFGVISQKFDASNKLREKLEEQLKIAEQDKQQFLNESISWKAKAEQSQQQLSELYKKVKIAK